jgi:hypothetical protein
MPLPLAIPLIMAGVGAASKLGALPSSIASQRKLQRSLDDLQKNPMARYSVSPEVTKLYQQSIGEASNTNGYDGAETSNFRNTMGRLTRGRYNAALSASGGQGSRAINSILKGQELDSAGSFFSNEAGLKRSNRLGALNRSAGFASQIQGIKNQNTAFDQSYRMQLEGALGSSIRQQRDFRKNLLNGLGSDLITSGLSYANGLGGGEDNTTTTDASNYSLGNNELYSLRGRDSMINRRNKYRNLGAYD